MNTPRDRWAAEAAASILNLHWDKDAPKSELFTHILRTILSAMDAAEREVSETRLTPSDN